MNKRSWSMYNVRKFCIQNNLYTCGDNEQYSTMLRFVEDNEPTAENIKLVAIDIAAHSTGVGVFDKEGIKMLVRKLRKEAIITIKC